MQRLIAAHDAQRAALSGVDAALHDWIGKRLGIPVWRLLGLERPRKQTTFTIGIADMAEIRTKVEEALAAGYDALKVKVGIEQDHETLSLIREVFDGPLLLDANQGLDTGRGPREKIQALAPYRPTLIEQPLRKERLARDGCAARTRRRPDLRPTRAASDRRTSCGCTATWMASTSSSPSAAASREALRMIALARGLGMQTMLGCFVSSSLAIAPALTIATLVDHADLDGHLLLADDPFEGIDREGGTIELSDLPGLGVAPRK